MDTGMDGSKMPAAALRTSSGMSTWMGRSLTDVPHLTGVAANSDGRLVSVVTFKFGERSTIVPLSALPTAARASCKTALFSDSAAASSSTTASSSSCTV